MALENVGTLTKSLITQRLVNRLGFSKKESKQVVESFYEEIVQVLENGESIKISGFGNFTLKDKKDRPGCNFTTGEYISIVARRVVTFKAGKKLRAMVNGGKK